MTPWRTISVALRGDVSSLVSATTTGSAAVRKFGAETETALGRSDAAATRSGTRWQTLTKGLAIGLTAVGVGLAASLAQAISWESAFAGVAKTVSGTTAELADLEDGLLDLSQRLPSTREEIAGVAEAAGALGIERQNIVAFTETMIGLGQATNLTSDEAATMLAQFANIMGTPQTAIDALADSLVNLGNNGASTEREILDMALRLAGAGATIGLTEDQVLALSNAMASMGIPAELGGSALSRVMSKIEVAVSNGSDKVRAFADSAGMSAQDFTAAWQTDPGQAFEGFIESLSGLQDEGQNVIGLLADLGIKGQQERDVMLRLTSGHEGLAKSMDDVTQSAGALATEVDKRYATAASQLGIFRNQVTNVGRVVGAALIPTLLSALDAGRDLGDWMYRVGSAAAERLEPAWESLQGTGENLLHLLVSLRDLGAAVATSWVGMLAGAAVLSTLTSIAKVLEVTTEFLADHRELVVAVGAAYAGWKVVGILKAASAAFDVLAIKAYTAAGAMAATQWGTSLGSIASGARLAATNLLTVPEAGQRLSTGLRTGLSQVKSGMNGLANSIGPVNAGLIGIAAGAAAATYALDRLHDSGKRDAEDFLAGLPEFDTTTVKDMIAGIRDLQAESERLNAEIDKGATNYFDDEKLSAQRDAINKELDRRNEIVKRTAKAVADYGNQTGLTARQVEQLAKAAGVDLADAFDESGKPIPGLVKEYERLTDVSEQWGVSVADAAGYASSTLDLLEEQLARIDEAGKATGEAWSSWADLLQITDNPVDQDAVKNSEKILADAKDRVKEAEAEAHAQGQSADDARRSAEALQDARDALGEAVQNHADLLASDSPLNADKIQQWFTDRLSEARTFTDNLNTALRAGFDPALVSQLMEAGPGEASAQLAALVSDTSQSYVDSINEAQAALNGFTDFAVRQAQLTQRAIGLGTRQAATDLSTALIIEQQALANPNASIYEIAVGLKLKPEDVARVVKEFNLDFEVDPSLDVVSEKLDEVAKKPRIAQIIAEAVYQTAEEDLTDVERQRRVAEIVAQALTGDAELDLQGVSSERLADIVALAITTYAEDDLGETAGRERIAQIIAEALTDDAEEQLNAVARARVVEIRAKAIWEGGSLPNLDALAAAGTGPQAPPGGWLGSNVIPLPPPKSVPGQTGNGAGGNLAPVVGTINVYEATAPDVTVGKIQSTLGLYG